MSLPLVPNPAKVRRDSLKALRTAWPHRHSLRGRVVARANIAMLRRLDAQNAPPYTDRFDRLHYQTEDGRV